MNQNTNENENSKILEGEEDFVPAENETFEEKAERLENSNKQLFARAKKAEGFELRDGKWVKPESKPVIKPDAPKSSKDSLTNADVFTLIKNNVPEEDISEVVEYANLKGISIGEALKSNVVKTILADNAEQRNVANGTNTNGSKRGNAKLSDDSLLSKAEKGELPDSDEDIARLIRLQRANNKK